MYFDQKNLKIIKAIIKVIFSDQDSLFFYEKFFFINQL